MTLLAHNLHLVKLITIEDKEYEIILFADKDRLENSLIINKGPLFHLSKEDFDACVRDEEYLKAVVEKIISQDQN